MHSLTANENIRLRFWSRVREFTVPPAMIESATARRAAGDWAGACAAARVDVDLNLRAVGRAHGRQFADLVRADLRQLAPDLLCWHFPRIAPDGLVRPGLTVSLARYPPPTGTGDAIHLVARTPPAWADAGQRISLALWDPSRPLAGAGMHPHPRPDRRFRLDLHRHLWDVRRAGELGERPGAADRWMAEAALLLRAEGRTDGIVTVRLNARRRVVLNLGAATGPPSLLPDAATWLLPDLELLRAGMIDADRLHPLVASALLPDQAVSGPRSPDGPRGSRLVECRGATHRIGVVNGVLVPLDHDADEIRREELLVALGGPALPCLRVIDETHRNPEDLVDVRARLHHGDTAGAFAAVEELLGQDVLLRNGALRDELETAVRRQVAHGLYRAGIVWLGPAPPVRRPRRRARQRHATCR
ncbi:hypothetical protein ALI144C_10340 [Actinosynnema sp. ALI-1.44]|uniref:hypothetical protein n=1 Tax=Actinosynnema sp. ALI-1.44 TaxID=1933779 RepID=UPI00097C6B13|nr:hypothetical protein [Actinosynnema sp. ALI-1.44]ONI87080.1 hypothetical protein ALI144C_10340 [Actinosynnema sp. ALI-1.44]